MGFERKTKSAGAISNVAATLPEMMRVRKRRRAVHALACRRIAARKSAEVIEARSKVVSGTRPRTGCTRRRRCSISPLGSEVKTGIKKVVLAYSGARHLGDLKWLQDRYGCDGDPSPPIIGQGGKLEPARRKAKKMA